MPKRLPAKSNESTKSLEEYRNTLLDDIIDDEKDYHTTITYIAAGALGLFLTINEKFFHLTESKYFGLFIISIVLLFTTLLLFIINTICDIRSKERLRDSSDEMIEKKHYDEKKLGIIWKKAISVSRAITYFRLVTLITGIAAEVVFILLNMNFGKPEQQEKLPVIRIEVPVKKDSARLIIDSSTQNKFEIKFLNH